MPIEIPEKMPLSGKKGTEFLRRLWRRVEHLEKRVSEPGKNRHFDRAELSALLWIVSKIIFYERILAKLGIDPKDHKEERVG